METILWQDFVKKLHSLCEYKECEILTRIDFVKTSFLSSLGGKMVEYPGHGVAKYTFSIESDVLSSYFDNLRKIVELQLDGLTYDATNEMRDFIQQYVLKARLPLEVIERGDYYRLRTSNVPLMEEKNLFHPPFECRYSIKTNRYSCAGYPALYMLRSIYTGWEESRRTIEHAYVARIEQVQPIVVLDLRIDRDFRTQKDFDRYMYALPLILLCSFRTQKDSDKFQMEYILPQLLFQLIVRDIHNSFSSSNRINKESVQESWTKLAQYLDANPQYKEKIIPDVNKMIMSKVLPILREKEDENKELISLIAKYKQALRQYQKMRNVGLLWRNYSSRMNRNLFMQRKDYLGTENRTDIECITLDGVLYSSTQYRGDFWHEKNIASNECLVIPTKKGFQTGFCPILSDIFKVSKPICLSPNELEKLYWNIYPNDKGEIYGRSYFKQVEDKLLSTFTSFVDPQNKW